MSLCMKRFETLEHLDFEFVSNFVLRISDLFPSVPILSTQLKPIELPAVQGTPNTHYAASLLFASI
jgi:hypothetical protein